MVRLFSSEIIEKSFFKGKFYMGIYRVGVVNSVLIWENCAHGM